MTKQITVGIHSDASYHAQVLDQLGIPSVAVESLEEGISRGVRVFLWNGAYVKGEPESASGEQVAVITDNGSQGFCAHGKGDVDTRSYYFELSEKSPFAAQSFYVNLPVFPIEGDSFGACYDRDNNEIANSGIGIIERSNRLIVCLPWDIFAYQQGVEWEHRPYFSPITGKHFVEVGPLLDTGAFRRLLLEILLHCFNWLGLPLVRVSPFYKNKRYFSFRVDADGFTESSAEAALRIVERTGLRFTWFLDMGRWKNKKKWVMRLVECNQDVQFHCFRHITYTSQETNGINIRKGFELMQAHGITPNAIVSPFGYNSRGFSEAIKEHGFAFSSEFGYAVDDLPSRPWNNKNYPLQIPVHPGCSGVFRDAGFTKKEQFEHLLYQIRKMSDLDGISILYDHPIGGLETHEAQYMELFDRLSDSPCEYICMSDYYRAWLQRPKNPTILFDGGQIEFDGFRDNGFRLEQVTNGSSKFVRWDSAILPQVSLPERAEQFSYPPEWIPELACKKGLSNLKQRNFSRFEWHMYELYLMLGTRTGYFQCRRSLCRVGWLQALRYKIRG